MMHQQPKRKEITHFWKDQQLTHYVRQQIRQAYMEMHQINSKYICLTYRFNTSFDPNLDNHVQFMITLGKQFPALPPQVHLANTFVQPSLKSYSDYFKIITGGEWSVHSQLKQITQAIPLFILKLQTEKNYIKFAQKNSQYFHNRRYTYSTLKQLSQNGPFIAFETQQQKVHLFVVSITSSHFVMYKPEIQPSIGKKKLNVPKQNEIDEMRITFMAEIQSLLQISHSRDEKNEYTFVFGGQQPKTQITVQKKKLKITKSNQMVQLLIKSFKNMKGEIDLQSRCPSQKSQEQQLLKTLAANQQKLKRQFNHNTVTQVNQSYQDLIEFYSSINLPYQEVFIRKGAKLFAREDVKLIMNQE